MKIKFIKKTNHIIWLKTLLKSKNISYRVFFSFFIFDKKNFDLFNSLYNDDFAISKTLNSKCGLDLNIIKYSDDNKIYNYKLAQKIKLISNSYSVVFKQEFDLDDYYLQIIIMDKKDIIHKVTYFYDNNYKDKELNNILLGKLTMSKERENNIIDSVINKLSKYELYIGNYHYFIKKTQSNIYQVELEHKDNGALILIKNIVVDDNNKVRNIGENKGLVL